MKARIPQYTCDQVYSSFSEIKDWGLLELHVPETWTTTQGEGVLIGVLDTGHVRHIDIGDNSVFGENFVRNEGPMDENSHSTIINGIICAKQNHGGMVGVAPKAKCLNIKVMNKSGVGDSSITRGLIYALECIEGKHGAKKKINILCLSLGSSVPMIGHRSIIKKITDLNVPVICAAGNAHRSPVCYPAAFPETIAVSAFNKHGDISEFSNIGAEIDFAGPGEGVYSTGLTNTYGRFSGTSFAAPMICGIVALMIAKHNKQEAETGKNDCKTVAQMKEHLIKYSDDRGAVGKDDYWGYGVIDARKIAEIQEVDSTPAPNPPTILLKFWAFLRSLF